jgi:hypothetical protein
MRPGQLAGPAGTAGAVGGSGHLPRAGFSAVADGVELGVEATVEVGVDTYGVYEGQVGSGGGLPASGAAHATAQKDAPISAARMRLLGRRERISTSGPCITNRTRGHPTSMPFIGETTGCDQASGRKPTNSPTIWSDQRRHRELPGAGCHGIDSTYAGNQELDGRALLRSRTAFRGPKRTCR